MCNNILIYIIILIYNVYYYNILKYNIDIKL